MSIEKAAAAATPVAAGDEAAAAAKKGDDGPKTNDGEEVDEATESTATFEPEVS